jgi:hypothetical protein
MHVAGDRSGRRLAALEVARGEQHGEAAGGEVSRDLKPDALIGAGDECDA